MVLVDVEPGDVAASELDEFTRGATDTATNVEYFHITLDADAGGQVVLVTGNGSREGLSVCESAKMEGLAPRVFVQVRGKVVVSVIVEWEISKGITRMEKALTGTPSWSELD